MLKSTLSAAAAVELLTLSELRRRTTQRSQSLCALSASFAVEFYAVGSKKTTPCL